LVQTSKQIIERPILEHYDDHMVESIAPVGTRHSDLPHTKKKVAVSIKRALPCTGANYIKSEKRRASAVLRRPLMKRAFR
jgi:hypothetical protein